jgi:hypothetical protein
MRMTAIGGGAGAGNMVDGGYNDDRGGAGGGSSGQYVSNYTITVTPGETISVTIGAGGANAGTAWGSANQGGTGGTTYIYTAAGNYYLLGGIGGYGGVGDAGNLYNGGTQTTTNTSLTGVAVHQGGNAVNYVGGSGGAGISGTALAGQYYSEGGPYHTELDAVNYGGGGAAGYYGYLRQDQGKHPGWGGKGKAGAVYFTWGQSQTFTTVGTTTFTVPNFVTTLTINAAGGGGGGGNLTDSGCNNDYGTGGGGSSGQLIAGYSLTVTPGQTISVTVGAGGSPQAVGGNTVITAGATIITLKGGNPGGGGECCEGVNYGGGTVPTGGPTGYYGYNGGTGYYGNGANIGGNGYGNTGGGTAGPYVSHHGSSSQSGGNGSAYGAGGGGASTSDNNSGGYAGGGYGYKGFVQFNWS